MCQGHQVSGSQLSTGNLDTAQGWGGEQGVLHHGEAFLTLHWAQSEQSKHCPDSPLEKKWSRMAPLDCTDAMDLTISPGEPAAALPGRDLYKMLLFHLAQTALL